MSQIRADVFVQQEMAARGITEQTGVFGEHKVKFGNGSPINLKDIKSAKVPFAGFRTATKIARGQEGVQNCAKDALKVLSSRTGTLDAKSLLGFLKATQTHLDRLDKLGQLTPAQKQDTMWVFTNAIQNLSNAELSAAFQSLTTPEMDLLQTALLRESAILKEGKKNAPAKDGKQQDIPPSDAGKAANMLFDLQAMVLKEVSNRATVSQLADQKAANPNDPKLADLQEPKSLTQQFGGEVTPLKTGQDKNDISASNLMTLVETSASSATNREKIVDTEQNKLTARNIENVSVKEMADVLRSAELTINMDLDVLLGDNSVLAHPDEPMNNIFHLADQGIKPKGEGYLAQRDSVEQLLFPEVQGHQRKADERPMYGALNITQRKIGALSTDLLPYGTASIVLKPAVAKRATYIANDTFFAPKFKIEEERRKNFYNLLDNDKNLPQGLKNALHDVNSKERKDMDQWLDKLSQQQDKSIIYFRNGVYPESVTKLIEENCQSGADEVSRHAFFQSLLIKSFGDEAGTRNEMVTHDNLEALIPKLGELNGNYLAHAAQNKQNGLDSKFYMEGIPYIEAQVQGPLIPSRDIAEIRIDLNEIDPEQHDALRDRMKDFTRQTGIPVRLIDVDTAEEDRSINNTIQEQQQFNMQHLDQGALNKAKNDILNNLDQHVQKLINSYKLDKGLPKGMLKLEGNSIGKFTDKFEQQLNKMLKDPKFAGQMSASRIVDLAFTEVGKVFLEQKAELLREVEKLQFETPEQKTAFVSWVRSAGALRSPEEVRIIHTHAQAQANLLKEILNADPAPVAEEIYRRMSDLSKNSAQDLDAFATKAKLEFGVEDAMTEYNRISFMGLAMLQNGQPPLDQEALQRLHSRINSPEMQTLYAQIDKIARDNKLNSAPDIVFFNATRYQLFCNMDNLANLTQQHFPSPKFIGELSLIPESFRQVLRTTTPQLAQKLDEVHPGYQPFPKAVHPEKMPQNEAQRRDFFVKEKVLLNINIKDGSTGKKTPVKKEGSVLDLYMSHEQTFEKGKSVHGRGHIARAYIFANVMCNMMEEMGVPVDKNAVLCGIAGHDMGREGGGQDQWEGRSADLTVSAMQQVFGQGTMGQDYEQQVADSIDAHKGKTLEAMLLNAADSLDIGRTGDFNPDKFPFLKGKAGETPGSEAQKIRKQLETEANLLQRMTDPFCAHRDLFFKLMDDVNLNVPEGTPLHAEMSKQKDDLLHQIADSYAEDWTVSSDAFMQRFENVIRDNPKDFPLLSKYYH